MAVHVRYNLYVSFPSSAKQKREMTKFWLFWKTRTTTVFVFSFVIERWRYIVRLRPIQVHRTDPQNCETRRWSINYFFIRRFPRSHRRHYLCLVPYDRYDRCNRCDNIAEKRETSDRCKNQNSAIDITCMSAEIKAIWESLIAAIAEIDIFLSQRLRRSESPRSLQQQSNEFPYDRCDRWTRFSVIAVIVAIIWKPGIKLSTNPSRKRFFSKTIFKPEEIQDWWLIDTNTMNQVVWTNGKNLFKISGDNKSCSHYLFSHFFRSFLHIQS